METELLVKEVDSGTGVQVTLTGQNFQTKTQFQQIGIIRGRLYHFSTLFWVATFLVQDEVIGLLVWTLIAGTEYFLYPAFGWVMFVAVFYWVLTVFFLIIYMTMTYTRIPQVPWTTVGLCFNGSAFILYLIAAIVDASSVTKELDSHNYNSWAASSFFAFVVTSCYAGNTYFSFISWRSRTLQ
nr:PREDICTED: CKLF-like MARVEL transmembrane domain-containing protein 8 [Struthio camelus australis]